MCCRLCQLQPQSNYLCSYEPEDQNSDNKLVQIQKMILIFMDDDIFQ